MQLASYEVRGPNEGGNEKNGWGLWPPPDGEVVTEVFFTSHGFHLPQSGHYTTIDISRGIVMLITFIYT
jgi:hypothetical protein